MSMLEKDVQHLLSGTFTLAQQQQHAYVTLEHLLSLLIEHSAVQEALSACLVNRDALKKQIIHLLVIQEKRPADEEEAMPTMALQRVIERAIYHAQQAQQPKVTALGLLASLYAERESQAVDLLERYGADKASMLSFIAHGLRKDDNPLHREKNKKDNQDDKDTPEDALSLYAVHLNSLVREGKIDPVIGRDKEVLRVSEILLRRRKNNPLLVGEPGVGKTAIAEGLAVASESNGLPEGLADAQIYTLDLGVC